MLFYLEYIMPLVLYGDPFKVKKNYITLVENNIPKINVEQHSITVTHIYGKGNILTPNYILRYELPTRI